MSANLYMKDGKASMAYVNGINPWHGEGQVIPEGADDATIVKLAGFDFRIQRSFVRYVDADGVTHKIDNRVVLFRDDAPSSAISVVSTGYKVVQPETVMRFFSDISGENAWRIQTAGVLGSGAKYWALAETPRSVSIAGHEHKQYMLLATSADQTMATIARPTDVCVVCQNTLQMALNRDGTAVRVPHSTRFDPDAIRRQLGMIDLDASWSTFGEQMQALADTPIDSKLAREYFSELLRPTGVSPLDRLNLKAETLEDLLKTDYRGGQRKVTTDQASPERAIRGLETLWESYNRAPGAAPGSAYGLVQGVTHFVDHQRGADGNRVSSAFFGQGNNLKTRALDMAQELVTA